MSAERERQFNDPEVWSEWLFDASSRIAYFFGINPYQEYQILSGFERAAKQVEEGESFISREGFVDIIEEILSEADKNVFQ